MWSHSIRNGNWRSLPSLSSPRSFLGSCSSGLLGRSCGPNLGPSLPAETRRHASSCTPFSVSRGAPPSATPTTKPVGGLPTLGRNGRFDGLHALRTFSTHYKTCGRLDPMKRTGWQTGGNLRFVRFFCTSGTGGISRLRNVAIIAHVDHGKTSLVDTLLKHSGSNFADGERVMDSNELEKERGITILSKQTSVYYKDYKINIVDTPGHGDFGGEVERVLGMVDGVLLLVDASEGPMTQTKYVLSKALQRNLRPIVVLNKMDRETARPEDVETEIFDLFVNLSASDEQLSYPTLYASARESWAVANKEDERVDMTPVFEAIINNVPPPNVDPSKPFSMLITTLEYDPHLGRLLIGRVEGGRVVAGSPLRSLSLEGKELESGKALKVLGRQGLQRKPLDVGECGDIIAVAGFANTSVTDTLCDPSVTEPIKAVPIDPPVLSMVFGVNDSPMAGKDGTKVTSTALKARILRELESNVTIEMEELPEEGKMEIKGRGELQLAILIENLRREGFELSVSPPKVLFQYDEDGTKLEPQEELTIDVDGEFSGPIIEKLSNRKAELLEMKNEGKKARMTFLCPSRALIGFRAEMTRLCRGSLVLHHTFHSWVPYKGPIDNMRKGALVSNATGVATTYALNLLEPRGTLFIHPQTQVYMGMIVGESAKKGDLDVNPVKAKQLSNVRSVQKEENVRLTPPRILSLEEAITYVQEDELVEIT
ncbi:50S ribosomal subunit assembly factor BipA [Balamuthia mandrillaris]